jgi:WD40 repeat protein
MRTYLHSLTLLIGFFFAGAIFGQNTPIFVWTEQEPNATTHRSAVAFSSDAKFIATGNEEDNNVKIWSAENGTFIRALFGSNNNATVIAFSPDGQYLATGTGQAGQGLSLNLWRVADGVRVVGRIPAFTNGTISVSFSPDSQFLVASGFHSEEYKVYHVPDMTLIATVGNFDPDRGYNVRINAVAFSPDGQFIAVGDTIALRLRRATDGTLVRTMNTNAPNVMKTMAVAFSPNGLYVAAGVSVTDPTYSTCQDCAIKVFRVSDGSLFHIYENGNNMTFPTVSFSPNSTIIAAAYGHDHDNGGAVQFWQVATGNTVQLDARPLFYWDFAYSPLGDTYGFFGGDGLIGVAKAPVFLRPRR